MEYTVGDGYEWSGTETVPFVYESAEKAIHDFECLLIAKFLELKTLLDEEQDLYATSKRYLQELSKIEMNHKLEKEDKARKIAECNAKILKHATEIIPQHREKIKAVQELKFGNQTFELECFRSYAEDEEYDMPNIYSLDEYFEIVENPELLNAEVVNA